MGLKLSISEHARNMIARHGVCNANIPSEEKHAETINVSLVIRRRVNTVDGRLEEVASKGL